MEGFDISAWLDLLSQTTRFITLDTPAADGLIVERLEGIEAVNDDFRFELDCVSASAFIELTPLIGKSLRVGIATAAGGRRYWHGIITYAAALGADGGLARYRLTMQSGLALLAVRRNAIIFQDRSALDVVTQVLADYPQLPVRTDVSATLRSRPICTQYRETDLAFIQRLLGEEGLSYRFEHDQAATEGDRPGHTLVIFDTQAVLPAGDPAAIRFHRIDATEQDDAISVFSERRQLVPDQVTTASWKADQVLSVSGHAQAPHNANAPELPSLDVFEADRSGRFDTAAQAQQYATHRLDALRLMARTFHGQGAVRTLEAGKSYTLTQHPDLSGQAFVPLTLEHLATNNLGTALPQLHGSTAPDTGLGKGSYRQQFDAVPADTAIAPTHRDRPLAPGVQSAIVVGVPGDTLTGTRDHQVRVQFPWQRGAAPLPGGLTDTMSKQSPQGHAPGDHHAGTWVRVAEAAAGANHGHSFVPRIGDEVLVEYAHGDLDAPVVVGTIYNGQATPPFAAGENSSANHPGTLSGVQTQTLDGQNGSRWVLDDASSQLRHSLSHSLADSQLNLGYLIDQNGSLRGGYRGEGFELMTAGWATVRAGDGLLLSGTTRPQGQSTQMDAAEAIGQLKAAHATAKRLDSAATQAKATPLAANSAQTELQQTIDPEQDGKYAGNINGQAATKPNGSQRSGGDPVERFAQPAVLLETPESLALTTPKSAASFAGEHQHLTSQHDTHLAAGATMAAVSGDAASLYTADGGMKVIANHGPVSLEAHTDAMEILADQSVTVTSTTDRIDVLAKDKIVLQSGQSIITLDGQNITIACPGNFTVKSGVHDWLGGEGQAAELPVLPAHVLEPLPERKLQSTFAFDQLTAIAQRSTQTEFVILLVPIFGFDIPAETYIKLYDAMRGGQIANPEVVVMSGGVYPAAFDNASGKILVHYAAVDRAHENRESAWKLMAILLHEFGHYIDRMLRTELSIGSDGEPTLASDAPGDEGANFAYHLALFDYGTAYETVFAQYTSPDYTGPLKVNYAAATAAIRQAQGEEAQRKEGKQGSLEAFSAGRGDHNKEHPGSSFGHESIEDALASAGFDNGDLRKDVYFGNWLRDYSQFCDPKIVRKEGEPKNFPEKYSRQSITDLVDLFSATKFPQGLNDAAGRAKFKVTKKNLGVYRPTEHIDNPKSVAAKPADSRNVDPDFEAPATPDMLAIDPQKSMKNYIARSIDFAVRTLDAAIAAGPTFEGRRLFGGALHVLEDYFSHSNFVELSLRKLGHTEVLPWTSPAHCKHTYPVVTGMFGPEDMVASLAEPLAELLFNVNWEFQETKPGERTPSDKAMLIILDEHSDPKWKETFEKYLWLRDQMAKMPGHKQVQWLSHYTLGTIGNLYSFVYSTLLHQLGNSVDDYQVATHGDPNTNGSTDPSHSQIAKDHDNHPFHSLAAELAKEVVRVVGASLTRRWGQNLLEDPASHMRLFMQHPNDTQWQDAIVSTWAKQHPEQVRRGASSTEWQHLNRTYGEEVRERIAAAGKQSMDIWNYMNKNYDAMFGENNQVKQ